MADGDLSDKPQPGNQSETSAFTLNWLDLEKPSTQKPANAGSDATSTVATKQTQDTQTGTGHETPQAAKDAAGDKPAQLAALDGTRNKPPTIKDVMGDKPSDQKEREEAHVRRLENSLRQGLDGIGQRGALGSFQDTANTLETSMGTVIRSANNLVGPNLPRNIENIVIESIDAVNSGGAPNQERVAALLTRINAQIASGDANNPREGLRQLETALSTHMANHQSANPLTTAFSQAVNSASGLLAGHSTNIARQDGEARRVLTNLMRTAGQNGSNALYHPGGSGILDGNSRTTFARAICGLDAAYINSGGLANQQWFQELCTGNNLNANDFVGYSAMTVRFADQHRATKPAGPGAK